MLRLLTAGESHGPALTVVVEGLPAGVEVDRSAIDGDLRRRQGGYGRGGRMKIETDTVEVLSGVRHGRTLGSPVTLVVRNRDHENWRDGDTVGGIFEVVVRGLPPGLGSFAQWDRRLDGRLAQALMSIQAVKAVAIGAGFAAGETSGARFHDEILYDDTKGLHRGSNRA